MKTIILAVSALATLTPAAVHAKDPDVKRFEHGGNVYSYTVTSTDNGRVIEGVEEKTGKPFTLRIGKHRVRGTVGSQQVSFTLRDVKPLDKPATTLASR
ncbi:hypothetical protein JI743_14145 [Sphingopyxis sp. DHUNG17]|uniref:hypothetical protein n=1 Tax=Sphingopyxis jiangsuensis TaxID=2871171 RepID=UPI00191F9125|nr:hypothetical protein [Sphingopyxis lutea]MBL0769948.1 hypothetical protein [Sphingopyxis lutea]